MCSVIQKFKMVKLNKLQTLRSEKTNKKTVANLCTSRLNIQSVDVVANQVSIALPR